MNFTSKNALLGSAAIGVMAIACATGAAAQTISPHSQFSLTGSFVYMRPDAGNSDYAVRLGSPGGGSGPGSVENVESEYGAGFQLGAAWRPGPAGLSLGGSFRYLGSESKDSARDMTGRLIATNFLPGVSSRAPVYEALAETDFHNHVFDFGATQELEIGNAVDVSIFGGLRYGSVEQNLKTIYSGGAFGFANSGTGCSECRTSNTMDGRFRSTNGSEFTGIGPRVAATAAWAIGNSGVSVFGHAGASLLVGTLETNVAQINPAGRFADSWPFPTASGENEEQSQVVPVIELGVGVGYDRPVGNGNMVNLSVGYDFENWGNAAGAPQLGSTVLTERNDVSLHGMKAAIRIDLAPR